MIKLSVKEKIIKTLLESPKTTGKIAIDLEYIDEKTGYGKYNAIKSDLNTLEQYGFIHRIKSNKKTSGAPATIYDIVYEIPVLREILKKFPSLISDLQKSDKILSLLANKDIFNTYIELPIVAESEDKSMLAHLESYLRELRYMLSLSPSFFHNYLMHDSFFNTFKKTWLSSIGSGYDDLDGYFYLEAYYGDFYQFILSEMFKHSVLNDFIKGCGNPDAVDFIQEHKSEYSLEYLQGREIASEEAAKELIEKDNWLRHVLS